MAFRTATSRRAGAGTLGTLAVLLAAALATGQPGPVLAATPVRGAVVRYGTPGFPETAESWPANRGNLFAGGAGGTAKLVQQTSVTPNARYDIAGWLVIGNTKQAPYLNSLREQGATLTNFYAEEHRATPITSRSPAAARSASRSPIQKRRTRFTPSTPRTSAIS
jgi:hypothetical protein